MKLKVLLIFVAVLLITTSTASALIILDFEGLQDTYYYFGGNTNIGNYYSGVNFGPWATILDSVIYGYNHNEYPPHSGNAVFFSGQSNNYVDITFDSLADYVEGWFTFEGTGYLEAYGASNNLVDSDSMPGNYGSNSKMSVSGTGIKWVRIHNTGDYWTGDGIGYTLLAIPPIPEPATMSLFGIGLLGLFRLRKRKV